MDVVVSIINAPVLGSSYQGGYVAYLLTNNDPGYEEFVPHGLIVAERDQSVAGIQWGDGKYIYVGAKATAVGTGNKNTEAIVAKLSDNGCYAAKLCRDDINPDKGTGVYTDWFLPSRDELYKICENHTILPNFNHFATSWSFSEFNSMDACMKCLYFCRPDDYGFNTAKK